MNPPPIVPQSESLYPVDSTKDGIPASTLVVFGSPDASGDAELLFVERSAKMTFAPGAVVFPGGRVDRADRELAAATAPHLDPDDAAARIAAIRETVEETGLLIGIDGADDRIAEDARGALLAGMSLADWLDGAGCKLELDRLTLFARWDPRFRSHRAFDTCFYIAEVRGEGRGVLADGTENSTAFWGSARRVLAAVRAGDRSAIFPTERNLERLAPLAAFATARADGLRYGAATITPMVVEEDGEEWLCIPEDRGYPVTRVPVGKVSRGKG